MIALKIHFTDVSGYCMRDAEERLKTELLKKTNGDIHTLKAIYDLANEGFESMWDRFETISRQDALFGHPLLSPEDIRLTNIHYEWIQYDEKRSLPRKDIK